MFSRNSVPAAGVSVALVFSGRGVATAAEPTRSVIAVSPASVLSETTGLSRGEEEQLERDLEVLFTRYVQLDEDDMFIVNEANLNEDGQGD